MSFFFNDNENSKNLDTLKILMALVSENRLGRLEIKESDLKITIDGKPCPPPPMPTGNPNLPMVEPIARVPQPLQSNQNVLDNGVKVETNRGNVVKAPIVGTFYASPSPDKPPYVKIGDTVKKGDIIMIVESMKLMNEVPSEFDGIVKEILVEDGSPVEFDQPIMIIE